MVLTDSPRTPRFPRYSGYPLASTRFRVRAFHPLWKIFPNLSPSSFLAKCGPTTPNAVTSGLGYSAFAHHYLRNRFLLSLPSGTEMFHFPEFALSRVTRLYLAGLPHSEIHDYSLVGSSSWLIAAFYVLLRRLSPRHPLCALCSLTLSIS